MNYAAFVITYERAEILATTVNCLFKQSFPPSHVLVVDNSSTDLTQKAVEGMHNDKVSYLRTGYNSGAAGGAYYGMSKLAEMGFEWILWVDDDDPPEDDTLLERLIQTTETVRRDKKVGMVGTVGSDFDFRKGELRRITNEQLLTNEFIEVRCIAGGMFPLINTEVIRQGALPNKDFFFAFEDLDFCLKVQRLGYKLIVPAEIMKARRMEKGRWHYKANKVALLRKAQSKNLWRQYYAVRNMTYLYAHTYLNILILFRYLIKYLVKIVLAYSKGMSFGWLTTKYTLMGFAHGIAGKLGKTVMPVSKY